MKIHVFMMKNICIELVHMDQHFNGDEKNMIFQKINGFNLHNVINNSVGRQLYI